MLGRGPGSLFTTAACPLPFWLRSFVGLSLFSVLVFFATKDGAGRDRKTCLAEKQRFLLAIHSALYRGWCRVPVQAVQCQMGGAEVQHVKSTRHVEVPVPSQCASTRASQKAVLA
jgi:hypothetical protein